MISRLRSLLPGTQTLNHFLHTPLTAWTAWTLAVLLVESILAEYPIEVIFWPSTSISNSPGVLPGLLDEKLLLVLKVRLSNGGSKPEKIIKIENRILNRLKLKAKRPNCSWISSKLFFNGKKVKSLTFFIQLKSVKAKSQIFSQIFGSMAGKSVGSNL